MLSVAKFLNKNASAKGRFLHYTLDNSHRHYRVVEFIYPLKNTSKNVQKRAIYLEIIQKMSKYRD